MHIQIVSPSRITRVYEHTNPQTGKHVVDIIGDNISAYEVVTGTIDNSLPETPGKIIPKPGEIPDPPPTVEVRRRPLRPNNDLPDVDADNKPLPPRPVQLPNDKEALEKMLAELEKDKIDHPDNTLPEDKRLARAKLEKEIREKLEKLEHPEFPAQLPTETDKQYGDRTGRTERPARLPSEKDEDYTKRTGFRPSPDNSLPTEKPKLGEKPDHDLPKGGPPEFPKPNQDLPKSEKPEPKK